MISPDFSSANTFFRVALCNPSATRRMRLGNVISPIWVTNMGNLGPSYSLREGLRGAETEVSVA